MKKINQTSAIIFDMDGLVLDTESTYCTAWQKASADMGQPFTPAFCLSMSGLHSHDIEKKLIDFCPSVFDLNHFFNLSSRYWRNSVYQHGIPIKKGFFNLLSTIQANNVDFCLATNSRKINALECLALAGLKQTFSPIITRDDVHQGKPAADIFLKAAQLMNKPSNQCIVIEDSLTGIQAAVNAKMSSIYIPSVLPADCTATALADLLLSDLDEVVTLFT